MLILFSLTLTCWLPTHVAAAHGAEYAVQVDREPAGDYLLTVMTSPASLHVGAVHFTVLITDRQRMQPLPGKQVIVEATRIAAGGEQVASEALLAPTLAYETHLVLPEAGRYQVTVTVVERDHARHLHLFEAEVHSVVLFQWLTLLLFAQALVVAGWLMKEGLIVWRRQVADVLVNG